MSTPGSVPARSPGAGAGSRGGDAAPSSAIGAGIGREAPGRSWVMGAYYFCFFGGLGVLVPYFPLWLEQNDFRGLGMSAIAALVPALSFVGPPLVGLFSDARGGRGNLLSAGTLLSCIALAGLAAAQALGGSGAFLVVFPLVLAFAAARSSLILLADRIAHDLGGHYGRRRLWGSIGFLLVAGGFGASPDGLRAWTPAVASLLFFAAMLASLGLPRAGGVPASPPLRAARRLLRQPGFVVFLVCAATFMAGHASYDLCGSLFFRDLGAGGDEIGLLWMTGVSGEIALFFLSAPLLSRVAPERLLVLAYACGAVRWMLTSQLSTLSQAFFVQLLHGVTFGVTWLASLGYVRRAAGPEHAGSAQGMFMAAQAAGGAIGMLVWGPLYEAADGRTVFVAAAIVAALTGLLAASFLGSSEKHEREL